MPDISFSIGFIVSFIIVTVLYGTLISPQLNKIGDIRDNIGRVKFPKRPFWGFDSHQAREAQKKDMETARENLEAFFLEYEIKESYLKRFIRYFWISVGLSYFISFTIAAPILQFPIRIPSISALFYHLGIALLLLTLAHALHSFLISSKEIRSINWLTNTAGFNPVNIWQIMDLTMYVSNRKGTFEPVLPEDPLHFMFYTSIHLTGYRYFLHVVDDNDPAKTYFVSYGPIGKATKVMKSMDDDGSYSYVTSLGGFHLNSLLDKELAITVHIFSPVYKKDYMSPFTIQLSMETRSSANPSSYITGRSGSSMNYKNQDQDIKFKGQQYRISKINLTEMSKIDKTLFKKYEFRFKHSQRVRSHEDLKGGLAKVSKLTETMKNQMIWVVN